MIHHPAPFGKPQFIKEGVAKMKQVTSMSRLTNQLEKMFRALNHDFYNDELEMPVLTVTPTTKAYAHYTPWNAWQSKDEHKREINISSAYLDRPLEYICASLLHEMGHMYDDLILGVRDTSRGGTYHNKFFKKTAESHGLICTRTDKYGWSDTSTTLSDALVEWVLLHNEFREIELYRATPGLSAAGVGTRAADGSLIHTPGTAKSNSRRFICSKCGMLARTTRAARLICGDCMDVMVEN